MARLPRLYVPGQPQHVILPGLGDRLAFVDDEDCKIFINSLRDAARRYETGIHAWKQLFGQPLDEGEVAALMDATLKGWALGGCTHLAWAPGQANRRISRLPRGRQRKSPEAPAQPQDQPAHCQTDYPLP